MNSAAPTPPATRQVLVVVWCPRVGEFRARVVLADGSLREFESPFELVRFLATPPVPPAPTADGRALR